MSSLHWPSFAILPVSKPSSPGGSASAAFMKPGSVSSPCSRGARIKAAMGASTAYEHSHCSRILLCDYARLALGLEHVDLSRAPAGGLWRIRSLHPPRVGLGAHTGTQR